MLLIQGKIKVLWILGFPLVELQTDVENKIIHMWEREECVNGAYVGTEYEKEMCVKGGGRGIDVLRQASI